MSDVDTERDLFSDDPLVADSEAIEIETVGSTRPAIVVARRVALVLFALSIGSLIFDRLFLPIIHDRSSTMLEERLVSDLKNGIAPVSNPIAVGTPLGLVEVPGRNIRAIVVEGTSARELAKATGHLIGSALPGQPGVAAVLGRSSNYGAEFANLDRVEVGDEILATTGQGTHTYEVIDITRRSANDMAAFLGEGHMLILSTVVGDSDRLVVRASLSSPVFAGGEPAVHSTSSAELGLEGDSSAWAVIARWLMLAALVALVFPLVVRQVGRRVAWMIAAPLCMWIAVEVWMALSLTGPSAL